MDPEKKALYLAKIDKLIQDTGVAIQMVFDPDGRQGTFAYTVGNVVHGLPELFVSGLPQQTVLSILNDVAARMRAKTLVMEEGLKSDTIFGGFGCVVRKIGNTEENFGVLRAYCELHSLEVPEVYQLVWPDPNNKFPWEEGASPDYQDAQELLYLTH